MPMDNYDDYELQNARLAAQSAREAQDYSSPDLSYDDYELGNARIARSIADMAAQGRSTDTMVAHVTPGDIVVPRAVWENDPTILGRVQRGFKDAGGDYRDHIVGHEMNSINPKTGQPEFFFKRLFRAAAPIIGGGLGFMVGGPAGAAVGSAAGTKLAGGSNTQALLSAGGSYLGSSFLGSGSGDVAGNLTQSAITRPLGESLAGTALGGASYAGLTGLSTGQTIAGMVGGGQQAQEQKSQAPSMPGESLDLSTPAEMSLPGSLSNLQPLSGIQRTSNIATMGVEGSGGVGKEGQDYFLNQVKRRLTTGDNNVLPIEQRYLSRLGVAYQPGNTKSILEGIARYQAA